MRIRNGLSDLQISVDRPVLQLRNRQGDQILIDGLCGVLSYCTGGLLCRSSCR